MPTFDHYEEVASNYRRMIDSGGRSEYGKSEYGLLTIIAHTLVDISVSLATLARKNPRPPHS